MKLYKALCASGAATMILLIAATVLNVIKRTGASSNSALIKAAEIMPVIAFCMVALSTGFLIVMLLKHKFDNKRK